jgi:hypothetical protein
MKSARRHSIISIGASLKRFLSRLYDRLVSHLSYKQQVRFTYLKRFRYFPDLQNPKTFSEKIQVRKLFDNNPLFAICADKVAVKDYVAERLGTKIVIPTLFVGKELPPNSDCPWPVPFVIKAAHGSGMNIFVRSKADVDWSTIRTRLSDFLAYDHSHDSGELFYSQIPRRILVEPFFSDDGDLPLDYKLFVFRGRTEMVQVDTGRATTHRRVFYDPAWHRLNLTFGFPMELKQISKPKTLNKMIEAAAVLARPFPFVRVDFYEIAGKPYFGEMTFAPESGYAKFNPKDMDDYLGALWV